jgi:hypothetical protein
MFGTRKLLLATVSAALAIGAVGAPVAAAPPKLVVVNGNPGKVVDVCIGAREVKSNLKYGRSAEAGVKAGTRTIRFRAAAPGTCTGSVLAKATIVLVNDSQPTVVGTRKDPKVVVFDPISTALHVVGLPAAGSVFVAHHAADVGSVTYHGDLIEFGGHRPAGLDTYAKGDTTPGLKPREGAGILSILALRAADGRLVASTAFEFGLTEGFTLYEMVLVGTNARNARFVKVIRPIERPIEEMPR